ncbi:hypothetical protein BDV26DRAFT_272754 [Aspergillus bertholletiae]|uniref:Uncharacterized protein n=1 Tax=Aspergillus bertholletiae TaxID=1226010 RepID=A0A5N7ATG8_9EURO|nr:hypothetical protein BDV26DRAFT_272754 [Aspergillus bertholletiae]
MGPHGRPPLDASEAENNAKRKRQLSGCPLPPPPPPETQRENLFLSWDTTGGEAPVNPSLTLTRDVLQDFHRAITDEDGASDVSVEDEIDVYGDSDADWKRDVEIDVEMEMEMALTLGARQKILAEHLAQQLLVIRAVINAMNPPGHHLHLHCRQ